MKTLSSLVVGALVLCASASMAHAQNIPIVNAGFEADVITPGAFVVLDPQGWSRYDPSGIIDQNNNAVGVIDPTGSTYFPAGVPEGNNAALVYLGGPQTAEAGLQQTLTSSLLANSRYTLSVQVGNIASGTSLPGSSGGPGIFYDLDGFPGYRLDLLAGGVVIGSDNNTLGASIPEGEFRHAIFNVDISNTHPQLGQNLAIRLVNLKQPGSPGVPNIEVDFDNVVLTRSIVAVPEAGTLPLLIAGVFPLIAALARRSRLSSARPQSV